MIALTCVDPREVKTELSAVTREIQRRSHLDNPAAWVRDRLQEDVWSIQAKILQSIRDHRKTVVMSCHEIGKSFIAARAVAWWIDNHPPGTARVVTTAPTGRQVRDILWKEIGRAHAKGLAGRTNQTAWMMQVGSKEETVASGFKPADYDPTRFQGIHAQYTLVIGDEACGIPTLLIDAMETLGANDEGRVLLLGNPDDRNTEFFKACKPGSGYNVIQVGAFDTPAFTGEDVPKKLLSNLIGRTYVEEKRKSWAPRWKWNAEGTRCLPPEGESEYDTNPYWQSKIMGRFPSKSDAGSLIPMTWIQEAQTRDLPPTTPNELGVDVGGGSDSSTVAQRRGPVVRVIHEDQNPNTMQTCGTVVALRKKHGATSVKVDCIGIGAGLTSRGQELGEPFIGINVGERAVKAEEFANKRSEYWWALRDRFEAGEVDLDPEDEDTAAELCSIRYLRTSSGKIQIETKADAKKRGIASPNRADAIMLAFALPADDDKATEHGGLVW